MSRNQLLAIVGLASLTACLSACAEGPKDLRVTSVSDANFQSEPELEWISLKPRPFITISKIEFSTNTDLLALARKHDYNVAFAVGPCSKDGVKQSVGPYGGVFWGNGRIYSGTKDSEVPGYAEAMAKGPPYIYQIFVEKLPANPPASLCLTLTGGSMIGGKLRSNDAVIPNPCGLHSKGVDMPRRVRCRLLGRAEVSHDQERLSVVLMTATAHSVQAAI